MLETLTVLLSSNGDGGHYAENEKALFQESVLHCVWRTTINELAKLTEKARKEQERQTTRSEASQEVNGFFDQLDNKTMLAVAKKENTMRNLKEGTLVQYFR